MKHAKPAVPGQPADAARRNIPALRCTRCGALWAAHREAGATPAAATQGVGFLAPTGGRGRPAWMRASR